MALFVRPRITRIKSRKALPGGWLARYHWPPTRNDGCPLFDSIKSRPILIGLTVIALCIIVYCAGIFYHQFINSPLDFASLVFIVAIYAGAVYHQVRGLERS